MLVQDASCRLTSVPLLQVLPPDARDQVAQAVSFASFQGLLKRAHVLLSDPASSGAESAGSEHTAHQVAALEAALDTHQSSEQHRNSGANTAATSSTPLEHGSPATGTESAAQEEHLGSLHTQPALVEVLLDEGRPSLLRRANGSEAPLPVAVPCAAVLEQLGRLAELDVQDPVSAAAPLPLLRHSTMPDRHQAIDTGVQHASDGAAPTSAVRRARASSISTAAASFARAFSSDNRAGISGTLHRVSAIRDVHDGVVGMTLRMGRHKPGAAEPLLDLLRNISATDKYSRASSGARPQLPRSMSRALQQAPRPASSRIFDPGFEAFHEEDEAHARDNREDSSASELSASVLLIGGPGTGKTTMLRDAAQQLSASFGMGRRLVVVDSTNEIGGYGRVRLAGQPLCMPGTESCDAHCAAQWPCRPRPSLDC